MSPNDLRYLPMSPPALSAVDLLRLAAGMWHTLNGALLHHDLGPLADAMEEAPESTLLAAVDLAFAANIEAAVSVHAHLARKKVRSAAYNFARLGRSWARQQPQ